MLLLPFPAPSERQGVGEAEPGRCTEEPPVLTAARPCSGGAGAYSGMASRWASVHRPAREGGRPAGRRRLSAPPRAEQARARRPALAHSHGMTPGDPALRRPTAALAQAAWPTVVWLSGRLGQRCQ